MAARPETKPNGLEEGPLNHLGHCSRNLHFCYTYILFLSLVRNLSLQPHDSGLWSHGCCLVAERPQVSPSTLEFELKNGSNETCSGLLALVAELTFHLTNYMLDPG